MFRGRCGSRGLLVFACLACCGFGGCSEGHWFPEVDGPPKGDERLYHSPYNHAYTRSREEVDADDAAHRERKRQQDRLDCARN